MGFGSLIFGEVQSRTKYTALLKKEVYNPTTTSREELEVEVGIHNYNAAAERRNSEAPKYIYDTETGFWEKNPFWEPIDETENFDLTSNSNLAYNHNKIVDALVAGYEQFLEDGFSVEDSEGWYDEAMSAYSELAENDNGPGNNVPVPDTTGLIVIYQDVIPKNFMRGNEKVKTVIFESECKYIGEYAFADCPNLVKVTFKKNANVIPRGMFENCSSLEAVDLPEQVLTIGERAFCNCISLKRVLMPALMQILEKEAFMNCSSLQAIHLSMGISKIPEKLFCGCKSLEIVEAPIGITEIESKAFFKTKVFMFDLPPGVITFAPDALSGIACVWVFDTENDKYANGLTYGAMQFAYITDFAGPGLKTSQYFKIKPPKRSLLAIAKRMEKAEAAQSGSTTSVNSSIPSGGVDEFLDKVKDKVLAIAIPIWKGAQFNKGAGFGVFVLIAELVVASFFKGTLSDLVFIGLLALNYHFGKKTD